VAGVLDGHGHNGGKISKWVAERLKAKLLVTPLHPATAEARPALLIFLSALRWSWYISLNFNYGFTIFRCNLFPLK